MMAERAQRQRAVAQDLGAPRGILAGIDQGQVQDLDRRGMVAEAVEDIAQHVARAGLQRLQALAALMNALIDTGRRIRSARARRRRSGRGPCISTPAPGALRHGPASGAPCRESAAPPRRGGPAGAPPGRDCRTASARWDPWPAPCATVTSASPSAPRCDRQTARKCRMSGRSPWRPRADRNSGSARSNHPARRYCRPVCRSGSGWGCVEDGGRGARAMARCVDPPHGQGYTKCHGQGCRSVRGGDGRCEAARRPQACARPKAVVARAEGRGTFEATGEDRRCSPRGQRRRN